MNGCHDFLGKAGIEAKEVSTRASALNDNCGQENLATDSWTWEEAAKDEHAHHCRKLGLEKSSLLR